MLFQIRGVSVQSPAGNQQLVLLPNDVGKFQQQIFPFVNFESTANIIDFLFMSL